jgi:glycerophosphoryl diester phosphodiesterase
MTMRRSAFFWTIIITAFQLSLYAQSQESIEKEESLHLLARMLPQAEHLSTEPFAIRGHAGFKASGSINNDQYEAEIDAVTPRVSRIVKNGEEIYKWPGIYAVGHRGALQFAPENTIASFKKAIELGANFVEMDVRETKDGQLIIMHDPLTYRTTGVNGIIPEMNAADILKLDAGSIFNEKYANEHPPTFDQALDAISGCCLPDVDFKAGNPKKVIEALRKHGLMEKATLANNDPDALRKVIELGNGNVQIRPSLPKVTNAIACLQEAYSPPIVNNDAPSNFRDIHRAGMKVFTNTMSINAERETEKIKAAISAGADFIQTDHLDILIPLLEEQNLRVIPKYNIASTGKKPSSP